QTIIGIVSAENVANELYKSQDHTISVRHCVDRRCRYLEPTQRLIDIWNQVYPLNLVTQDGSVIGIAREVDILPEYAVEAEYKLKELYAVFEFAHNGIVAIDEYGTITSFNPAAEKMSKVSRDEAIGKYITY